MSKEIKVRALLVRVPKEKIGLFSALVDGSGRKAIVRTKERSSDQIYLIATPHTFSELFSLVDNIKGYIEGVEILGEVEDIDVGL